MKIAILQHSPDTPPGVTTTWLEQQSLPYKLVKAFRGEPLPTIDEVDWLIVLGGGMNIDDEKNHPFLREEKKLVEQVLKFQKTYLGLCLGGQMLARVMGAQVRKHTDWEVGWHSVQIENRLLSLKRAEKEELAVFQWHQDTFDIPSGALSFAKNTITPNQGFVTESANAIATQFHPEADEAWVRECADDEDLPVARFAQTKSEILNGLSHLPKQSSWYSDVMAHLTSQTRLKIQG